MKKYGNLLSTMAKVTIDRGDLIRIVIMSWNEDLLDVDHRTHDNWVVYFKTWSRRSLFSGRAQTCRNQSDVFDSLKPWCVMLTFETKILRSDIFAQRSKIWGSVSGRDRVARARCPRSSVEAGQKCFKFKGARQSNILLTFGKFCVCLHQVLNLRNHNFLSTPVRQCIWSAKRTWVMLKWILWRNRAVLR